MNPCAFANKFSLACVYQDTNIISEGHNTRNFLSNGEDPGSGGSFASMMRENVKFIDYIVEPYTKAGASSVEDTDERAGCYGEFQMPEIYLLF